MTSIFDAQSAPQVLRLKSGEDRALEMQAAAWLAKGREGVTALSDKRDWLSHDQLMLRYQREVSNSHGFCDESLIRGMFKRTFNPTFGHRPSRHHYEDEG